MDDSELKTHVTVFANVAATTLTTKQLTLEELAERVRNNPPGQAWRCVMITEDKGRSSQ